MGITQTLSRECSKRGTRTVSRSTGGICLPSLSEISTTKCVLRGHHQFRACGCIVLTRCKDPVVFIAHSLGGILVKSVGGEAMNRETSLFELTSPGNSFIRKMSIANEAHNLSRDSSPR
jgi:hypothetical protein